MRTENVQDSRKTPESRAVENPERTTWRTSKQDISDEVLHSKTSGVGKAKRKTRRGKRGGVKRRMQNLKREQKMLESVVGEWIKDIRHKTKAPQSDHAPSRDVTVNVLASDVEEMSISPSDVEHLYDYEHYFPEEIATAATNMIDSRVDARTHTGSGYSGYYHSNNSTIAHGYGEMEMVSAYGNEATVYGYTGYGTEATGCGYYGQECGCRYGNGQECGCRYGNGQECGCRYGNGQECGYGNGYSEGSSYNRYCD